MNSRSNRFRSVAPIAPLIVIALLACKSKGGSETTASSAAASATGAAAAAEDLRAQPGAVCAEGERKVWGKWGNPRTGITTRPMGDKIAMGVALGNRPYVLTFDKAGNGQLAKVSLAAGSALADDIPKKDGQRDLQRVTPVSDGAGGISAYADYRDKYNSKRRRISCEHVGNKTAVLVFDGTPLLERDEKKPATDADAGAPVAGRRLDPKAVAALARRLKLSKRPATVVAQPGAPAVADAADAAAPPAAAQPPAAEAPAPEKTEKKPLREIRDCRTFVDVDGDVWGVGSELYGEPQDDDSVKWSMRFFVAPDAGGGYYLIHSAPLPKTPKELHTLEAPTAGEAVGGGIVLAGRYRGALMTWMLNAQHRPTGRVKTYRGGWPTLSELSTDDSGLMLLTSQKVDASRYEIRYGRIGSSLPSGLERAIVEGADPSTAEPSLAQLGGQRWLAFQAGKREEGQLMVVPVDASLKSVGKAHEVAPNVSESKLVALSGDKLLAVYIERSGGVTELVSRVLSCSVQS